MSLSAVSLFSGAGGMDVGMSAAGFDVQFANDLDDDACETYLRNHGNVIRNGDLRDHFPTLRQSKGVDLVFGGPPCQGFSVAGKMDPGDVRSQLLSTFFDVVDELRPKAFICENVKALAVLSKWSGIREEMQARTKDRYNTALLVLNASSFGVPQSRDRMFFVGIERSSVEGSLSAQLQALLAAKVQSPETVGEVVRRLGRAGSKANSRTCAARITYARNPVLRASPYAGMLFNGAGRPQAAGGISSTLAASMGGNKTPIVDEAEIFDGEPSFVHAYHQRLMRGGSAREGDAPARLRRLTIDECIALQTFPPNYNFAGRQSAVYRQLGNAVPCRLAEAVGSAMRTVMSREQCALRAA